MAVVPPAVAPRLPKSSGKSLPEDDRKGLLESIRSRVEQCERGVHKKFTDRANHFYGLYRSYQDWKRSLPVDRRDRDLGLKSAAAEWGTELFIPYAYSTVETILPRMLSNRPAIVVQPRARASEENVENVRYILQAQQEQIDYELILQAIARDALIMGLGVQKVYWKTDYREMPVVVPSIEDSSKYVKQMQWRALFDDPVCERVDPFDFFWDPFADSMRTAEWVCQRSWRGPSYCKQLIEAGFWTDITVEDLEGNGSGNKYRDAFQQRQTMGGYTDVQPSNDIHEVWEYHDGEKVTTVVDRQFVVQCGVNPAWHGELPFQVYRPTPVPGQLAGIGEIEPIEDLQAEINMMRSQRRDNATVVLQRSFFYADGMIDPSDFKIGPGRGIPVLGSPSEAIMPIQFGDIPHSGYQEERQLQADIERTTGIDDSLSGSGQVGQTATGVQLVQAAANLRIQQKTRNCEVELVRAGGRQMLALNQQKILTERDVRIPSEPSPQEPDRRWAWLKVGPKELAGEFEIDIEGGSMAPENVPQQRSDAQAMAALMANNPTVDPAQATKFILKNMGIKNPDQWIIKPQQMVPAESVNAFGEALKALGVDEQLIQMAQAASQQAPDGQ